MLHIHLAKQPVSKKEDTQNLNHTHIYYRHIKKNNDTYTQQNSIKTAYTFDICEFGVCEFGVWSLWI